MTDRKIIFVHQPKSAGTSLIDAYIATYGKNAVYNDQDIQLLWKMRRIRRIFELYRQPYRKYDDRKKYRVIHGHFRFEKYRVAYPDAFYMTLYRHPVQVIISQYYYWRRVHNPADANPLRKWVYQDRPELMVFVSRWIKSGGLDERARLSPQAFDFVGIAERYEDSMRLLKLRIPDLVFNVRSRRVNPEKSIGEGYKLVRENEEALYSMLKPLILLYDAAVLRFESDWNIANQRAYI